MEIKTYLFLLQSAMSADAEKSSVKKRLGKNPDVDTSFLPDVDRVGCKVVIDIKRHPPLTDGRFL